MDIIANYLLIGWIFGFVNLLMSLNESDSDEKHYIISQTLAIILYWPIIIINIIYYFVAKLKEKIKNFTKK